MLDFDIVKNIYEDTTTSFKKYKYEKFKQNTITSNMRSTAGFNMGSHMRSTSQSYEAYKWRDPET